uniref:Uncharacterized protein n=1 Tax=Falco tinnunculus TaxID=100819 RepID=A0A8C4XSV2_FALTI
MTDRSLCQQPPAGGAPGQRGLVPTPALPWERLPAARTAGSGLATEAPLGERGGALCRGRKGALACWRGSPRCSLGLGAVGEARPPPAPPGGARGWRRRSGRRARGGREAAAGLGPCRARRSTPRPRTRTTCPQVSGGGRGAAARPGPGAGAHCCACRCGVQRGRRERTGAGGGGGQPAAAPRQKEPPPPRQQEEEEKRNEEEEEEEEEEVDNVEQVERNREEEEKKKEDALWASFLSDVGQKPKAGAATHVTQTKKAEEEKSGNKLQEKPKDSGKVTITKTFDFAGEEVRVTKEVDSNSKEAKSFLKQQEKWQSASPASLPTVSGLVLHWKPPNVLEQLEASGSTGEDSEYTHNWVLSIVQRAAGEEAKRYEQPSGEDWLQKAEDEHTGEV